MNHRQMLEVAKEEARLGALGGGVPVGAALFGPDVWAEDIGAD